MSRNRTPERPRAFTTATSANVGVDDDDFNDVNNGGGGGGGTGGRVLVPDSFGDDADVPGDTDLFDDADMDDDNAPSSPSAAAIAAAAASYASPPPKRRAVAPGFVFCC